MNGHDAVSPKDGPWALAGNGHSPELPSSKCSSAKDKLANAEVRRGMRITFKASPLQAALTRTRPFL